MSTLQSSLSEISSYGQSLESQLTLFYYISCLTNVWQDVRVAAFLILSARQPYHVSQQTESEWGCTVAVQTISNFMS